MDRTPKAAVANPVGEVVKKHPGQDLVLIVVAIKTVKLLCNNVHKNIVKTSRMV